VFLIREFIAIVESFFRGQILIGLIMGVLLGTGFTIIGLEFGFALGLLLGVLNIVPYLGTILGLAVACRSRCSSPVAAGRSSASCCL